MKVFASGPKYVDSPIGNVNEKLLIHVYGQQTRWKEYFPRIVSSMAVYPSQPMKI